MNWVTGIPVGITCFDSAGDPAAGIGPDGTLYLGMLGFYSGINPIPLGHEGDNGVFVFTSGNGGKTWIQHTVFFDTSSSFEDDKDWLTVDNTPGSPTLGRVYEAWTRFGQGVSSFGGAGSPIRLAYSDDKGVTWNVFSTPVSGRQPPTAHSVLPWLPFPTLLTNAPTTSLPTLELLLTERSTSSG